MGRPMGKNGSKSFRGLSNQGGYVVVMAILIGAVLIINGVAVYQLYVSSNTHSETVLVEEQMANLTSQVDSLLNGEFSCRTAIGGPIVDCYSGANPATCPVGDSASAQPFSTTVGAVTNIRLYKKNGTDILFSSTAPNNIFGRLTITGITLTTIGAVPGGTNTYRARLSLEVSKPAALVGSTQLVRRNHIISVRTRAAAPYNIVSCTGLGFAQGGAPQSLPVCQPGQGLISLGGSVSCVQMICDVGYVSTGLSDTNGNVLCIPGVATPAGTPPPTATPAGGGL